MVKALCPDGIESWLVISVPVPNFHTCLNGNCWGWPKYVCDEMTVEKEHSEVIYEGKVRLSMDFTPGGVDEATIKKLKAQGTEGGNTISFAIDGGTGCLMRQGRGLVDTNRDRSYFVEWEPGMVKTFMRPEDKCARLLPENCVTPGFWQWSIGQGWWTSRRNVQSQVIPNLYESPGPANRPWSFRPGAAAFAVSPVTRYLLRRLFNSCRSSQSAHARRPYTLYPASARGGDSARHPRCCALLPSGRRDLHRTGCSSRAASTAPRTP